MKQVLALVDDSVPACAAVATAFTRRWRSEGGQSIRTLDLSDEARKKLTERLSKSGAELLLFAGKASDLLAAGKLAMPVLFGGEEVEWRRLEQSPPEGATVHGAVVQVTDKFTDEGKDFLKRYKERHHEDADADAWRGYEAVRLLTVALRQAKGTGAYGLRERLTKGEDLHGLTGKLSFKGVHAVRPLYVVKPGASSAEKEYPPEGT
jgi:ABC-type branched-subunit amino acid transport system substrate-binding protein